MRANRGHAEEVKKLLLIYRELQNDVVHYIIQDVVSDPYGKPQAKRVEAEAQMKQIK